MSSFNLGTSKFANLDTTRDCLLAQFFGLDLSTVFFGKIVVELVAARRETFMLKGNPTGACMCETLCACCQCRAGKHSQHTTNLLLSMHSCKDCARLPFFCIPPPHQCWYSSARPRTSNRIEQEWRQLSLRRCGNKLAPPGAESRRPHTSTQHTAPSRPARGARSCRGVPTLAWRRNTEEWRQ